MATPSTAAKRANRKKTHGLDRRWLSVVLWGVGGRVSAQINGAADWKEFGMTGIQATKCFKCGAELENWEVCFLDVFQLEQDDHMNVRCFYHVGSIGSATVKAELLETVSMGMYEGPKEVK